LSFSGWSVAGAAIATGAAGILGASLHVAFASIAAFGAIFTALGSFASMREAVGQDRRNAERYGRTYELLRELDRRLDLVREAVLSFGNAPLLDYVLAINEQLSLEHRQWLGQTSAIRRYFQDHLKP